MANLRGIVNKLASGKGAAAGTGRRRTTARGVGAGGTGTTGRRSTQDEAIGRGVRGLISRFRR
jgi:hypothetical protein